MLSPFGVQILVREWFEFDEDQSLFVSITQVIVVLQEDRLESPILVGSLYIQVYYNHMLDISQ